MALPAEHGAFEQHVAWGWTTDGRWWVQASWDREGWLFTDDATAQARAQALMTQPRPHPGVWEQAVAEYDLATRGPVDVPRYPPAI